MRAVLDANVFVSALISSQGPSAQLIKLGVEASAFELVTSPSILIEIRRSLSYQRVRRYLKETDIELDRWVAAIGVMSDVVDETQRDVRVVTADHDDDKYLSTALEGRAGFVVSGDRHLLDLKEYQGIQIVPPRAFLEMLKAHHEV